MVDIHTIAQDASWLPHRIRANNRTVEFIRIAREQLGERGFLADRDSPPSACAVLSWDDVIALNPARGPVHFVFHSAFCRSTLLVRALDAPGLAAGLNEPGILASMVSAGDTAKPILGPVLALLARPWSDGEVTVIKPTNHANILLPMILQKLPESRAILMSNALPTFLRSVTNRGLLGRNWARKLFLEMQNYAGMDFGMTPQESFAMSDLQAAGLAWFLNQRFFTLLRSGQVQGITSDRFATLDGDRFDSARETTIAATFSHFDIAAPKGCAQKLARGPVFGEHAKLGGTFSEDDTPPEDNRLTEEIDLVTQWIGLIAQQAGIETPMRQTLFE